MTGLEVADVMVLAQAGSGGHPAASTGPGQKRYRAAPRSEGDVPSRHHSVNECVRERVLYGGKVTQPTDTPRSRGCLSTLSLAYMRHPAPTRKVGRKGFLRRRQAACAGSPESHHLGHWVSAHAATIASLTGAVFIARMRLERTVQPSRSRSHEACLRRGAARKCAHWPARRDIPGCGPES